MSDGGFQPYGPPAGRAQGVPLSRSGFAAAPDADEGGRRQPARPLSDRDFVTGPVVQRFISACMVRGNAQYGPMRLVGPDPDDPSGPPRWVPDMARISELCGQLSGRGEPTDPSQFELKAVLGFIKYLEDRVPLYVEPSPPPPPSQRSFLRRLRHGVSRGGLT